MRKKIIIFTLLSITIFSFVYATKIFAYNIGGINIANPGTFGEGEAGVGDIINRIFNIAIIISQIVFVVLLLIGGIQYLTSAGNEESAGKARKLMLNAVIGLVIVLAAWGAGTWILDLLQNGQSSAVPTQNNTQTTPPPANPTGLITTDPSVNTKPTNTESTK